MALRSFGVRELEPLTGLGHVGADEAAALARERRALGRLRYGLHLVARRAEERLRFDYQRSLAERLGFVDDAETLGVEKMMQCFYRSAAIVRRVSERLLQRFEEHFAGSVPPQPLDTHFEQRGDYLAVQTPGWLEADPAHVFALFAAWANAPALRGLHSQTARELALSLPLVPAYDAASDAMRDAFLQLLRGPQALKEVLTGIERWMEAREYDSVAQLKGSMSQQNLPNPSAFARAAYLHALDSFTPPAGVRY